MCNSCPSLSKSPESDSRSHLQPDSAHCESAAVQRQRVIKYLPGGKVRPRSLGQSDRRLFGAWHHNIFTADFCFSGHSTKCASCSPPLRQPLPLETEEGESCSDALPLARSQVNLHQRLKDPREFWMNGRIWSHSWIAPAPPRTHTYTHPLTLGAESPLRESQLFIGPHSQIGSCQCETKR